MHPSGQVSGYDIIGDVHGCADALCLLLEKLGYREGARGWHHPERKAVFVGDIIDRGSQIRAAMHLVRRMVDTGAASLVLGNHEYNAVAYQASRDNDDPYLIQLHHRLGRHLQQTLHEYRFHADEWLDTITWLRDQPLCLEFSNFRVVHACWDARRVGQALAVNDGRCLQDEDFLQESLRYRTEPNRIVERLLKGTDLILPEGVTVLGSDGIERNRIRTKFWKRQPETYGDVLFQPDKLPDEWMQRALTEQDKQRLLHYGQDEKVLFVGHYWRRGEPRIIRDNIACLDYSAVKSGRLVAYRMGHEQLLNNEQFVWVKTALT